MIFSVASPLNKKGYGLLEILVASVIGSVLISGSARFLQITLQAHNISQSLIHEDNLRKKLKSGLESDCENTDTDSKVLKPSINGLDSDLKGAVDTNFILPGDIKKGDYKGQIDIVKIELKDTDPVQSDARTFTVYYKKKNLGTELNAPNSANCTATATSGCYNITCELTIDSTANCTGLTACDTDTIELKKRECGPGELVRGIQANGELICEPDCKLIGKVKKMVNGQPQCVCPDRDAFNNEPVKWINSRGGCFSCGGTWRTFSEDQTYEGREVKKDEPLCDCHPNRPRKKITKNSIICCRGKTDKNVKGRCCPNDSVIGNNEGCCGENHVSRINPSADHERQNLICCHKDFKYYQYHHVFGEYYCCLGFNNCGRREAPKPPQW